MATLFLLRVFSRNLVAGQGLAKRERIGGRERLGELFDRGAVGKSRLVLVRALENGLSFSRIAAIAGKAAGRPAKRNRLRRRLRAAFRTYKQDLPKGLDLVLLARKGLAEATFADVVRDLKKAVSRAAEEVGASTGPLPCAAKDHPIAPGGGDHE
jgi:ribonuclease P protein component, eubacterial